MRWDTSSGRMMTVATGNGAVRRIHFAPPAPPELAFSALAGAELQARVAVLFASGAFGVWELDSRSELRQVRAQGLGLYSPVRTQGPGLYPQAHAQRLGLCPQVCAQVLGLYSQALNL